MAKYSPKIDLVFRKLFGSEENKDLLLSLLNAIIDPPSPLTDLIIKNPYNLASYVGGKMSIVDIKAVDQDGVWYGIEMQLGEHGFYGKRALYYLSKMYVDQLAEGGGYSALNKTIGIHLIDFDYFPDDRYRRHFVFKDMDTNDVVEHLTYQQLYFIELVKFRKAWDQVSSLLDRWISFLNRAYELTPGSLPTALQADPEIVQAVERLDVMRFDKLEQEIYEAELKARLDDQEELRTATEKGREQGVQEGMRDALQRLMASGLSEPEARNLLGLM